MNKRQFKSQKRHGGDGGGGLGGGWGRLLCECWGEDERVEVGTCQNIHYLSHKKERRPQREKSRFA